MRSPVVADERLTAHRPIRQRLAAAQVLPIATLADAAQAEQLASALVRGGLPLVEVTLRTPAALDAIGAISDRGDVLVGAGTVLTSGQVDSAADLGAAFIVSPGLDPVVVDRALERGLLPLPGVATPSEVQAAVRLGLDLLKVFPVSHLGGPAFISALAGPFPWLEFVPSGGITHDSLMTYLRCDSVLAAAGAWMMPADVISMGEFDTIERRCRDIVELLEQS